jgi:hypothetical protein
MRYLWGMLFTLFVSSGMEEGWKKGKEEKRGLLPAKRDVSRETISGGVPEEGFGASRFCPREAGKLQ